MPEIEVTPIADEPPPPTDKKTMSEIRVKMLADTEASVYAWLQTLSADMQMRISLHRVYPKVWQGRNIEGSIDEFDEPISEEDIRNAHGGGKYKLKITTPDKTGSWKYFTTKTIKIAGDPKLSGLIDNPNKTNGSDEAPSVVRDAMRLSSDMVERAQNRADRAEGRGPDPAMQAMVEGMQNQMQMLQRTLADKDTQILRIMAEQSSSGSQSDAILSKMIDGDNARIAAIRTQVDSELRTKDQSHQAELERVHQRYEDQARRQEDAQRRETDSMKSSLDMQTSTLKMSYEGQMEGLKREIMHLDRELTAAKVEVAELRAKKDKTMVESMTEMAAVKDAIATFGGGSDEKEEGGTIERIVSSLMGSSLAEGIATRIATAPEGQAAAMAPAEPELPVEQPITLPDGRVILRRANGDVVQIRKKEAPPPGTEAEIEINPAELKAAVEFMEAALRNDTDPEDFARSVQAAGMLPTGVIDALRSKGIDHFLSNVAKIDASSPLFTQHGKNWARKVATILIG